MTVIATIEWSSDSGREPSLFLADTAPMARRAIVEHLTDYLPTPDEPDGSISYIDLEWVSENPLPDLDDDTAIQAWLEALREATTDAWVTIFTAGNVVTSSTFLDLRA